LVATQDIAVDGTLPPLSHSTTAIDRSSFFFFFFLILKLTITTGQAGH
jgi:hypothetical protein